MTELLQNWLNNEIELSQPIQNFEKDFANGYLFGELLFKFNQQSNFKEFSKKYFYLILIFYRETVASKLENFNKLEVTLRNLKIKFDSKMVDNIIKEKRGEALRLLYQLRMALEKVYPPTDIAVLRKTGKMGDNQPALKIAPSKEKYDTQAHTFFQQRLQVLNKPQKILNQERHLQKFEDEKVRQEKDAQKFHKEQLDKQFKIKQEIRAASINKLQRNAGFMEEWLQKGVEDWKKNQSIKKEREKRELEFEYNQTEKFNNLTMRKVNEANNEVNDGIANFEMTLQNAGINPYVKKDHAERAVSESLQGSPAKSTQKLQKMSQSLAIRGAQNNLLTKTGGMTLTSTGLKGKDKKTITDQTRKERERRRRKMIVDQSKTLFEMDQKRRESQIVSRMQRQSKQEVELGYEEWRTKQCRNVMSENRKLREARYEKRRELDQQNANWREQEMIRSLEEQINRETAVLLNRDRETRIMHKQAKREGRTEFASVLFDSIFEIANQAYIHQQQRDTEEIDPRNWHEWMELFVEQLPINASQEKVQEEGVERTEVQENSMFLDHIELVDYLENKGQWSETLITEYKVNIEQVLTGQGDQPVAAAGGKGAKAPAAKAQVEQIQLEEGDTELPQNAPNNYALGDAIETIININFEERQKQKRPIIPNHLNLKVCLIGYQFAGKKSQAEKIKELFGLQVFKLDDLVQQAIQFSNFNLQPIEADPAYIDQRQKDGIVNKEGGEEYTDTLTEPDLNEECNPQEDFRLCGLKIQECLMLGEDISDELYVQLFIAKLRLTFPYKTKRELYFDSKSKVYKQRDKERRIVEIDELLNAEASPDQRKGRHSKKKNTEELEKEKEQLIKEIEQLRLIQNVQSNGWVLVDFPSTFAQAKLLETALSGHVPKAECDPIKREIEQSEAGLLVKATEKEIPPQLLIKSGVDCVIWFDCSIEKCLNRAIGRRFDETNEKMYHIQQQPPLTTNAPLCERLIPMNEEANPEATLLDRWIAFDSHSRSLENWLTQFGDADIERCILTHIDGNGTEEEVFRQIEEILNQVLKIKQERENELRDVVITNRINEEEEQERERLRKIQEEEDEKLREQEGAQTDRKEEQQKKEQNKVEKPGPVGDKIGPKPPDVSNIDNDIKPSLLALWQKISTNYKNQMKKVFKGSRDQRERIIQRFHHIQKEFLHFLHRPDQKQEKLEHFIQEFNDFSDQYPDLREDDQTKEELHQRCDILSDELWEIIEERKDQQIEERKKIMESGWIEFELQFLVQCAQQLMQAEVDRFKGSIQLIHDYYHLFEDKLIPEAPPLLTNELVNENEELPPVESLPEGQDQFNIDNYTYPRLDKIFERALKSQVVPDVTIILNTAQDKKGAPAKAKDPKKPAQEEEKPQEESLYVKEMKRAIKVEKSLLRYRLVQIRNWTLKRLKEMRQKSLKVYSKLEDWIHVSVKTENDAIDEMCVVIKRAIEEEKKIQDELRIKFMDFCVDEKIMNYIDPPPERLPQLEQLKDNRFSIPQLRSLVQELSQISTELGNWPYIPNKVVTDLFVRRLENSKGFGDENGLPEEWKHYTEYDFQTIVRNLDKYNFGQISWKLLATYICLLQSPILIEKDADSYQAELLKHVKNKNEQMIDQEHFLQAQAWFDQYEYSQDRDYSIPFPRVQYIKELLFNINNEKKNGDYCLNVKKLISLLKAKEMTMFKRSIKVYADILFAPIEK